MMTMPISRRIAAFAGATALAAVAVLGAASPAFATKPASDGEHKVPYCHATHSEKNPYVFIETDKIAVVRAHNKHQDLEDHYPSFVYLDTDGVEKFFEGRGDGQFAENGCVGEPGGGIG